MKIFKFFQKLLNKIFRKKRHQTCRICGENNIVIFNKKLNQKKIRINIWGTNNRVEINTSDDLCMNITIGVPDCPINNAQVIIGEGTFSNGTGIILLEDNQSVIIGKNCMLSADVKIWASDTHSIFDPETKKLLNPGKDIIIGDHCWIGRGTTILKNVNLAPNTICGFNSVITSKASNQTRGITNGAILAGNPAKLVKTGVSWSKMRAKKWLYNLENGIPYTGDE